MYYFISLASFVLLVITLQLQNPVLVAIWIGFALVLLWKKAYQSFAVTSILFALGFALYLFAMHTISFPSKETTILIRRLCLLLVFIPFIIASRRYKQTFISYWQKPKWKNTLYAPFIWRGPQEITIQLFLIIAISINIIVFIPFLFLKGLTYIQHVFLFAILFSIINAVLEEWIWRGILLTNFTKQVGEKWAVVLTSAGFGLQHYSLGFPWIVCISFSIGGFFYGGITVKANSILPAVIWHTALNLLMVCSGMIL
ncbi:CPBP family intramembrane glutamic endopeptidase [Bacillus rhizoplanae]|uniref:CPBP family intramembrane glutamic endopeptidase n=1 Tax=Bacillus rhizoplanae TaxID=2880966 RepID=UPI003D1C5463